MKLKQLNVILKEVKNLVLKDLFVMLSDKKAFILILLMPMVLMMILGFSLGPAFSGNGLTQPIVVAIVKEYDREHDMNRFENLLGNYVQDHEDVNIHEVIEEIESMDIEKIFFKDFLENDDLQQIMSYQILDRTQAEEKLSTGNIGGIVLLPENFIYDMYINFITPFKNEIQIEIIQHPNNTIRGSIVESIMKGFFDRISSIIISKNVFIETAVEESAGLEIYNELEIFLRKISEDFETEKVNIEDMQIENSGRINSFDYYAAAMLTMFSLYLATIKSRSLMEENNQKTLQRVKVSGVSMKSILLSNYITVFVLSMLQIIIMITYAAIALKVDWGAYSTVGILIIAHAVAIAALSAFIGAMILKLQKLKIADFFESAAIPVMAFMGGSFIHYSILPAFIQKMSHFTVNGLAIRGYIYIMLGYGVKDIFNYILGLILMSGLLLAVSIILLQKRGVETNVDHYEIKNTEIKG
ncbi:ABC-2 type transport system permease protein [Natronincola peptidivorans]|uniref:ABC-2 type transport system permease protein n=1 Tax=Natronincola peptidivorans TaxID=426128 RepID=A0A1I0H6D7_9FIRM|nr:ABC transporter permease [Natronincola peptidivorans]SET79189.1 ABC-2 type transport system permease protein [Natronincola peptidivorans]